MYDTVPVAVADMSPRISCTPMAPPGSNLPGSEAEPPAPPPCVGSTPNGASTSSSICRAAPMNPESESGVTENVSPPPSRATRSCKVW